MSNFQRPFYAHKRPPTPLLAVFSCVACLHLLVGADSRDPIFDQ